METVCQTCGDLGWSVALIYCEECQNLAVHRYCLKRFPKTFDEYVVWHCDDCKSELPLFDGVRETISIVPDGQNDLDLRLVDLRRTKNKRLKKSHINKKKAKIQQVVLGDDNEPQEQEIPISGAKRKSAEIEISDGGSEPSCCTISLKDEVEEEPVSTLENEADDSVVKKSKLSPLPELDSSRSASYISYVPAQPIIDPIWRGRFSITPKQGYSCQVLAHLSSLACFRVSQEAKLFPEILSSELHPRLAVWPKGFDDHGPNDDSIALYLFPESESDERVFKNLLNEMIRNDHALRAVVTHAELLVFPSTKLPLRHWRFQKKLYLWGVFRAKQASPEVFNPDRHNADKSHTNTTENRPLEVS